MPELPEVETTVRDLRKAQPPLLGAEFVDVWTDFEKMTRLCQGFTERVGGFTLFKEELIGRKILKIRRRGKNILFELSGDKVLLIHQKLMGHLLYGKWQRVRGKWKPFERGPLAEPVNRFLHLIFFLDNGRQLALSDLRKFAKVELWDSKEIEKELSSLGAEPLSKNFTFKKFREVLLKSRGKIKQVLMNQKVIAGIGNIYSNEILWEAKISPFRMVKDLSDKELRGIYKAMKKILKRAIELKGESISDFRRISGKEGLFDKERKVYRREGEKCSRCGAIIQRKKIAGRSAYFCPHCQS